MKLRRLIDGTLADGRGSQLFIVLGLIAISFGLFWGLSALIFGAEVFKWQDIIALYLDPGVFGGAGEHDWFRLIVTLAGVVLVAATLISVFSNIFENISDGYRKGELRYRFKNHILIIGANDLLIGLLEHIKESGSEIECETKRGKKKTKKKFANKSIVIMTTSPIEKLRDEVEAYFNDSKFTRRITFYYDRRENKENLKRAGVERASYVYILGENNEPNHDILNLMCVKLVRDLDKNRKDFECLAIMESQTTMKAYQEYLTPKDAQIEYKENIVNINECRAELALENSCIKDIKSFKESDEKGINIVILGMSALGRALAITAAYALHFKNRRRTKITIIDEGIENKVHEFKARYNVLFDDSDYIYSNDIKESHKPRTDVSWRFIDSCVSNPEVMDYLRLRRDDSHLYIFVCDNDIKKNIATEVALRNVIDRLNVYSDFGEYVEAFAMYDKQGDNRDAKNGTRKFAGLYGSLKKKDQYSYIFEKRHEAAKKSYEDTNKVGDEWSKLSFSNKHRRIFESVVHKWWNNQEAYDFQTCYRDILSIAVYGESGDWFRHLAGNIDRCVSIDKLKRIQKDYCNLLNNDIEGDLADYLASENYAIIWDDRYSYNRNDCEPFGQCTDVSMDRFIINEDLLNALLCYSVRRNLSDASVSELFKLAAYDFKEKEKWQFYDYYRTDEEVWIEENIFTIEEPKERTEENAIKVAIKDALQNSFNLGNRQAKLALLGCELQEKQNASDLWIESFNGIIEYLDNQIPEWFLEFLSESVSLGRIPFEVWKSVYSETGKEEILDHRLLTGFALSNKKVLDENIKNTVDLVKRIDATLSDGDIYLRIASVPGIHIIQKCVWLTKASQYFFKKASESYCKEDKEWDIRREFHGKLAESYRLLSDCLKEIPGRESSVMADEYIYRACLLKSVNSGCLVEYIDGKFIPNSHEPYEFDYDQEGILLDPNYKVRAEYMCKDTNPNVYLFGTENDPGKIAELREKRKAFEREKSEKYEENKSSFMFRHGITNLLKAQQYELKQRRDTWRKEFPGVPYWEDYKDQN